MLALLSFKGYTQISKSDSTKIPNAQLETVYRAAEKGKVYKAEVRSKEREIALLNSRIANKDSAIGILTEQADINREVAERFETNYKLEQVRSKEIQASYNAFRDATNKAAKKQKRQSTFKTIGIGVVAAAAGVLAGTFLIN